MHEDAHRKRTGSSSSSSPARGRGSCCAAPCRAKTGEKKVTIAQREVLRRKVEKIEETITPRIKQGVGVLELGLGVGS